MASELVRAKWGALLRFSLRRANLSNVVQLRERSQGLADYVDWLYHTEAAVVADVCFFFNTRRDDGVTKNSCNAARLLSTTKPRDGDESLRCQPRSPVQTISSRIAWRLPRPLPRGAPQNRILGLIVPPRRPHISRCTQIDRARDAHQHEAQSAGSGPNPASYFPGYYNAEREPGEPAGIQKMPS